MPKLIKLRADQTNLSVQMASIFYHFDQFEFPFGKLEMATHQWEYKSAYPCVYSRQFSNFFIYIKIRIRKGLDIKENLIYGAVWKEEQ